MYVVALILHLFTSLYLYYACIGASRRLGRYHAQADDGRARLLAHQGQRQAASTMPSAVAS